MNELGLLRLLAEIPAWGTGLGFVAAVIGGILVSRRLSVREEFADSYVTMGVLGFGGLIAVGSLVPGLFFELDNGTRFLLGLGVVLIGLGIWMLSREMLPGRLGSVLCLLYVAIAATVYCLQPQWYFDSGDGTRAILLISATFVVPLSLGRLLAMALRMEDLSFRMGFVLTAITLALWPMAKEVVARAADNWVHEEAVKTWDAGNNSYPVTAEIKESLGRVRPTLMVHYLSDGKSSDKVKPASRPSAIGEPAEKPAEAGTK